MEPHERLARLENNQLRFPNATTRTARSHQNTQFWQHLGSLHLWERGRTQELKAAGRHSRHTSLPSLLLRLGRGKVHLPVDQFTSHLPLSMPITTPHPLPPQKSSILMHQRERQAGHSLKGRPTDTCFHATSLPRPYPGGELST